MAGMYGMARPIAYTPVVTWGAATIAAATGVYLKTPGLLQVWVSFQDTAGVAGATLTITTPAGYTAALTTYVGQVVGNTGNVAQLWVTAGAFSQIASLTAPTPVVTTWSGTFVIPTTT